MYLSWLYNTLIDFFKHYSISGHLYFWGVMYIIVTTLVLIFVHEKNDAANFDAVNFKVKETYIMIFKLLKLPNIQKLIIILLSIGVGNSKYVLI